jgi:uncharacterized iron-regulated membrane protein
MTLRKVILFIHLCLGLAAGLFLTILGLTGSIMAFEADIGHWLRPELWYVTPGPRALPENDLVSAAQNRSRRARVIIVQFPRAANLAQVMQMTDGSLLFVNPYDGTVLGEKVGLSNSDQALIYIHRIHQMLVPDPKLAPDLAQAGKIVVSVAALLLFLLLPTGLFLWRRSGKLSMHWKATDFKVPWYWLFHDAHQVIGIYVSLFLMIASITGMLIGFGSGEKLMYWITRSAPPAPPQVVRSVPVPNAAPLMADRALAIARQAMPNATVSMLVLPVRPVGTYLALMRVPEETSETVHSSVTIDQFSGKVLNVRNYMTDSPGYRLVRFNRSIHTGDVFGLPTHILLSLSSLMLVAMVVTGVVIFWKKLAV